MTEMRTFYSKMVYKKQRIQNKNKTVEQFFADIVHKNIYSPLYMAHILSNAGLSSTLTK